MYLYKKHTVPQFKQDISSKDQKGRERRDNGLFIKLVSKVLYERFLIRWLYFGNFSELLVDLLSYCSNFNPQ